MNANIVLTGAMRERLSNTLRAALAPQRLAELLEFRLDKRLDDIAMGHDYREIMFRVIRESQRENWTVPLVIAARDMLPGNEDLFSLAQELGVAAITPPRPELERMLAAERFVDVSTFLDGLATAENAVCKIEVGHDGEFGLGTGFRIAPGLVLTARHVLEPVMDGLVRPHDTVVRFGYRRDSTGNVVHCEPAFLLARDWLADSCEDGSAGLDYVLARLANTPTEATKSLPLQDGAGSESCIGIPRAPRAPREGRMVCILQHPAGEPLKLAFGRTVGVTDNATKFLHTVNTLAGSSGSPCFDSSLNLIGLHHAGTADSTGCNTAISMTAIAERLAERGVDECRTF